MSAISHLHLTAPRAVQGRAVQARAVQGRAVQSSQLEADQLWVVLLATAGWLAMSTIAVLLVTGIWSPLDQASIGDAQTPARTPAQKAAQPPTLGGPAVPRPRQPQPDVAKPHRTRAPQPRTPESGG